MGNFSVPKPLVPVQSLFQPSNPPKPWTKSFYVCGHCKAIWAVASNPKDLINNQTPTPPGMKEALAPEATLDDLMQPLFAWAPIDEMTEHALWEIDYEPQELFDRLVEAWRHPACDVARQADILRQLTRLVRPNNSFHAERQQTRGWLLDDFRGFQVELTELEHVIGDPQGSWAPVRRYAQENLADLQSIRKHTNLLRGSEPPPIEPPPKEAPEPETRQLPFHATGAAPKAGLPGPMAVGVVNRMGHLLRHPLRFVPGVLFGWFFVERVGAQLSTDSRPLAMGFLFLVALVFPGAVVASNSGITSFPWWRVLWRRLSAMADYAMVGLGLALAVIAIVAFASLAGVDAVIWGPDVIGGITAGVSLLLLTRIWPFVVIPYMQAPEVDIPDPRSPGYWRHQAVWTAWKLTQPNGTFRRFTLPWMLAFGAAILATTAATSIGGAVGRSLVLYPIVLPALTALTWALVEQMAGGSHKGNS